MTKTQKMYRKEPSLLWHGTNRVIGSFKNLNKTGSDVSGAGINSAITTGAYFAAKFVWPIPFFIGPVLSLIAAGVGLTFGANAIKQGKAALYNRPVDRHLSDKVSEWKEKGNQFKPGIAQRLKLVAKKAYGLALTGKSIAIAGVGAAAFTTGATLIGQSVISGISAGMTGLTTVAFKAASVVATSGLPGAGAIATLATLSTPLVVGMVAASVVGVVAGTAMTYKGIKGARQNYKQKFVNVTYEDVTNKPSGNGLKISLPKINLSKIGIGKKTAFNSKASRRSSRTRRPARTRTRRSNFGR